MVHLQGADAAVDELRCLLAEVEDMLECMEALPDRTPPPLVTRTGGGAPRVTRQHPTRRAWLPCIGRGNADTIRGAGRDIIAT